jgi:hypothetical protein
MRQRFCLSIIAVLAALAWAAPAASAESNPAGIYTFGQDGLIKTQPGEECWQTANNMPGGMPEAAPCVDEFSVEVCGEIYGGSETEVVHFRPFPYSAIRKVPTREYISAWAFVAYVGNYLEGSRELAAPPAYPAGYDATRAVLGPLKPSSTGYSFFLGPVVPHNVKAYGCSWTPAPKTAAAAHLTTALREGTAHVVF